ncbi:hypothetical protein EVAR_87591_1 [Eumeta japonica]|uniref:Uncharacterized protein n=1 Tax=Eumeta variegata TaxID=151549 RepID=A0A4C1WL74_EUMVA|nr:hypothetical protein EVAR_87591_1 [Eumeta japonica]
MEFPLRGKYSKGLMSIVRNILGERPPAARAPSRADRNVFLIVLHNLLGRTYAGVRVLTPVNSEADQRRAAGGETCRPEASSCPSSFYRTENEWSKARSRLQSRERSRSESGGESKPESRSGTAIGIEGGAGTEIKRGRAGTDRGAEIMNRTGIGIA